MTFKVGDEVIYTGARQLRLRGELTPQQKRWLGVTGRVTYVFQTSADEDGREMRVSLDGVTQHNSFYVGNFEHVNLKSRVSYALLAGRKVSL